MSERIRAALELALATLTDERIGMWSYMEGSEIYGDFSEAADAIRAALSEPETAAEGRKSMPSALAVVLEQAGMESLWFVAEHIFEDHLQQELRRLHEAVERDDQEANKGASGSGGK